MSTHATSPLEVYEIIARIGEFIPLWLPNEHSRLTFTPGTLVSCTAVSTAFRQALLPILWRTYDISLMQSVPDDVVQKYSPYFRILHRPYSIATGILTCARLVELTVAGTDMEAQQLVRLNPLLKTLDWTGPTEYCLEEVPVVKRDMLLGLKELETLRLSEWSLGQDRQLMMMLRTVGSTLRRLTLDTISGGERDQSGHSSESLFLPMEIEKSLTIRELSLNLQFTRSRQLVDLVCCCPDLEALTLVAVCEADIRVLSANLGRHCPRLSTIKIDGLNFGLFDTYRILPDELMAELVWSTVEGNVSKSSNSNSTGSYNSMNLNSTISNDGMPNSVHSRGLVHLEADCHGFEPLLTTALIACSQSLRSLKLTVREQVPNVGGETPETWRIDPQRDRRELSRLVRACTRLESVTVDYEKTICTRLSFTLGRGL
ncbi:hypothetical protein EDD21DRAFT_376711 [Dissophora ornata]|nr:hypothetical protein EDD21DRAFT_376711 [Dissophora ornata]